MNSTQVTIPTGQVDQNVATLCVRLALAASFLSAVADRFGIWGVAGSGEVAWGGFTAFVEYTGTLLWYLPKSIVNVLACVATAAEILLAAGLLCGIYPRMVAFASSLLLATFAISMTISTGAQGPFSYSVWTASAAAFLLASLQRLPAPRSNDRG